MAPSHDPGTALEAFSRQAPVFDTIDRESASIARMRGLARTAALRYMHPGEKLLELNAGTGIDSLYFAEAGIKVVATDAASGMLEQLELKRTGRPRLPLTVRTCSYLELDKLGEERFNHVFSNFGGLNCTDRIEQVMKGLDHVLLRGGTCTLVIMPRFSPWELATLLKGNLGLAFRRWRRGGTAAHLEGQVFPCYYHSTGSVKDALGKDYDVIEQRSLSLLFPPPHTQGFPANRPAMLRALHRMEETVAHRWPFRNWGDHYLITLRKRA